MDLQLKGKAVLITGGSKGIGLACARVFLREGARVAISSRDPANLEAAKAALRAEGHDVLTVVAELKDPAQAESMAREVERVLGPLDVLVNSAGAARRHLPEDLDAEAWRGAMDAKYFTAIHPMDAVLPGMAARGSGSVVNIIGQGGKTAIEIHLAGGAANSALMLATVGLAKVYAPKGVRVNAINPGSTLTDRVNEALDLEARKTGVTAASVLAAQEAKLPMRRFAKPEEVAEVAAFLASDRASYVTGAIVPMDGGALAVI